MCFCMALKSYEIDFFNKVSDAAMSQKINNSFKSVKVLAATCKTLSHLSWNISGDILLSRNTPASQLARCKTSDLVLYGCIQIKGVHQVVYNYRKYQTGTVAFSLWAHSSPPPHTHQFQHVWTDYFGICSCLEMAPRVPICVKQQFFSNRHWAPLTILFLIKCFW